MSDFRTVLVKDDRLNCKSSLVYEVYKSGQQITQAVIKATSANSSQHVFNVIVPSQNVLTDRNIKYEATIDFKFSIQVGAGTPVQPVWASNIGTCAFPLNSLITTMQATINNNTVSIESSQLLPFFQKLFSREDFNMYQETTPCMPDNVRNYADAVQYNCNVLAGVETMNFNDLLPRGAFKLNYLNTNGQGADGPERWNVSQLASGTTTTFYGSITVSENLFLSPFLFSDFSPHRQGIYGINNMSFIMNIGQPIKFIKSSICNYAGAGGNQILSVPELTYKDVQLRLTYITPHPSDLLPARNIVPYMTFNRFSFLLDRAVPAAVQPSGATHAANPSLVSPVSTDPFSSNVINLNQIPDKFLIGIKPTAQFYGRVGASYGDFFIPITGLSISFNNNAGLLSNASQKQLWKMSQINGLHQTWSEYYGVAMNARGAPIPPQPPAPAPAIESTMVNQTTMMGGFLVISPGSDLNIVEEYLAPGSIGNYQFQIFNIKYENWGTEAFLAGDLELIVIPVMSGMMVFERGTSAVYTAVLSKEMVLEASAKKPYYAAEVRRKIGGNFWDDFKTGFSDVMNMAAPVLQAAAPLLAAAGESGGGVSGGGVSGGGVSGGKKRLARHM